MTYDTKIYNSDNINIKKCADLIKQGEVVGMPTETVYGLAANAFDSDAVARIFIAKGRPQDNPLIVHIANMDMLEPLVKEIPQTARILAENFWPGPLTMIFKKKDIIPNITSGGLDSVGIRMPSNKVARAFIEASGVPLAAPSANLSGSPSPTTAMHVYDDMKGRIPAILDDGNCSVGVESTVICFEENDVRILRPGFVTAEELSEYAKVVVDKGVCEKVSDDKKVMSPGMKYKHYSPKCNVIIVDSSFESFKAYYEKHKDKDTSCVVFSDEVSSFGNDCFDFGKNNEEQAIRLFDILRELDKYNKKTAYFRCPAQDGVGLAVYNRLLRAAGFEVIKL